MNALRRRILPSPLLSLVLALAWPVLNQSWSLGHCLLGGLLALVVPWFTDPLRESRPTLRRPAVALRLMLVVLKDIVSSNIAVARLILGPETAIRPAFVWLPLTVAEPHAIVTLSLIVTMTPGTLSADLSPDGRHLLIHALNVDDPAALIADIKARYEAPLLEILR